MCLGEGLELVTELARLHGSGTASSTNAKAEISSK
jgi:hypothetical protein